MNLHEKCLEVLDCLITIPGAVASADCGETSRNEEGDSHGKWHGNCRYESEYLNHNEFFD